MNAVHSQILILGMAVLLDLVLGEPPTAVHPVAWMGSVISFVRKRAPRQGRVWPFVAGLLLMLIGCTVLAVGGTLLLRGVANLPQPLALLLTALLLKTTFSIRGLWNAGREVQSVLVTGDLPEARKRLSWHLVSRDTSSLNESQVAAATIESLSENASDSILAPLLAFAIAGLPGALVYRFINTCDAMLGYRDSEREWLGKAPARLDDLANLIPARVTALLLITAGAMMLQNPVRAIHVWCRDRRRTASPNAGHPMSATAGVLCVELEKVGHYRLGSGFRLPDVTDVVRVRQLLLITAGLACMGAIGLILAVNGGT
ncbi:MAG: cobalamin biosynthesis protein [Planctomycetes bacterium]|nr:cobalamin biosynthesis protein [Planctomycetota bacterium]